MEDFIAENGHLPNTPSAKEIQRNGLNLGEITTNQQAKIEELFLHMIDMEKRLEKLEDKNKELRNQLSEK